MYMYMYLTAIAAPHACRLQEHLDNQSHLTTSKVVGVPTRYDDRVKSLTSNASVHELVHKALQVSTWCECIKPSQEYLMASLMRHMAYCAVTLG